MARSPQLPSNTERVSSPARQSFKQYQSPLILDVASAGEEEGMGISQRY